MDISEILRSEIKVRAFLLKRKNILNQLGIPETDIHSKMDLKKEIFQSKYFNNGMRRWIDDWSTELYVKYTIQDLYPVTAQPPETISQEKLLVLLTRVLPLDSPIIKWRGKISPEGWAHNYRGTWKTDKEMVDFMIEEWGMEEFQDKPAIGGYND